MTPAQSATTVSLYPRRWTCLCTPCQDARQAMSSWLGGYVEQQWGPR